jgi:hypothetical protein
LNLLPLACGELLGSPSKCCLIPTHSKRQGVCPARSPDVAVAAVVIARNAMCVPGLQIEACKIMRNGAGNHPRRNGVLAEMLCVATPDSVFWEPTYHCRYVKEESVLPGDDDLDFLRERICTGHQ